MTYWFGCNCPKWLTCKADALMHALHIRWAWLCDRHDRNITGEMDAYNRATGADKSLADYFDGLRGLPKGPIRKRRSIPPGG